MKNIEIKVSKETRMVFLEKNIIGNDGENLQEKLVFSFKDEFVDGQARLEYEIDGEKYFAILTKVGESYEIPVKNVMAKEFQINMQLVITEGTDENEIPVFKSNVFYVFVNKSINAETEEPDGYAQWLDIANTKLNSIDEAIRSVQEAIDYAQEQGDYAKEQAENVISANAQASEIIRGFESNVNRYTNAFNTNAENQLGSYNTNATEKLNAYNTNTESKLTEYNNNATSKTTAFNTNVENKTNTFNENTTEKLNAYNTNAETKKNEYDSNAETKLNEFNENANTYIDMIVPKNDASGVPIYVDDALEYKVLNLGAKGNYEQETTTGIQEFNANAITNTDIMISDNGQKITLPTVTSGNGYVKTNETLGELCPNLVVGDTVYLYFDRNLGTSYNNRIYLRGSSTFWSNGTSHTITSEDLATEINMYGNNYDSGETEQCILSNFQITKVQNANWEPFTNGASPNPDYQQEIEFIEGDVSHRSVGKNLFDKDAIIDGKWLKTDGTEEISANYCISDFIYVIENKTYYLPKIGSKRLKFYNSNKQPLTNEWDIVNGDNDQLITIPINAKYVRFSILKNSIDITTYQFEQNLVATDYEPYQETITPIDLKGNFVGKLPNGVADRLLYKDRHIYLEKNISKVVLDGSESITMPFKNVFYIYNNKYLSQNACSNYYTCIVDTGITNNSTAASKLKDGQLAFRYSTNSSELDRIYIKNEDCDTVSDFQSWLSAHNTELYFELESPELIDLGEYDLSTLQGTNNITLLANLEPSEMNLTYALDIKKYTDKKIASLSSQIL